MFTPKMMADYCLAASRIAEEQAGGKGMQAFEGAKYIALSDMCNETIKHMKPAGGTLSQAQLEVIRDMLVPIYVPLHINQAVVAKMRTMPVYHDQLLEETHLNHMNTHNLANLELVLGDIINVKPDVDLNAFCKVEVDPETKLFILAFNPNGMVAYQAAMVESMSEIPVIVKGERVVN